MSCLKRPKFVVFEHKLYNKNEGNKENDGNSNSKNKNKNEGRE